MELTNGMLISKLNEKESSGKRLIFKFVLASMADSNGVLELNISAISQYCPMYRTNTVALMIDALCESGDIEIEKKDGKSFIYLSYMRHVGCKVPQSQSKPIQANGATDTASSVARATTALPALPDSGSIPPDSLELTASDVLLWARWLARHMAKTVLNNYKRNDVKVPNGFLDSERKKNQWVTEFRLMIHTDKISPFTIKNIIDFLAIDKFWGSVVLSPEKLRKQCLRLQMAMPKTIKIAVKPQSSKFSRMVADEIQGIVYDYEEP